jgi:hypothetical protein
MNAFDGALRGFRSARQAADAIRYSVEVESFVSEEAVFIITAEFSDVGKCGTA